VFGGLGEYLTLKCGPGYIRNPFDYFMLRSCRASADWIVLTGKVLREEPTTSPGPPPLFQQWRQSVFGKASGPSICILTTFCTRGGDDRLAGYALLDHHLFRSSMPIVIYTTRESYRNALSSLFSSVSLSMSPSLLPRLVRLQLEQVEQVGTYDVAQILVRPYFPPGEESEHQLVAAVSRLQIVGCDDPDISKVVQELSQSSRPTPLLLDVSARVDRSTNVSIQTGPHTANTLYRTQPFPLIETLFLSVYRGPLSDSDFIDTRSHGNLTQTFLDDHFVCDHVSQDLPWSFYLFRRRSHA